jgi:hypothetical protein
MDLYTLPVETGGGYLLFAIGNLNGFVFAKAVDGFSNSGMLIWKESDLAPQRFRRASR